MINYLPLFSFLDRADNYQTCIIIFSVCGVVLVIAIVIAIVCFVVVRRKRAARLARQTANQGQTGPYIQGYGYPTQATQNFWFFIVFYMYNHSYGYFKNKEIHNEKETE